MLVQVGGSSFLMLRHQMHLISVLFHLSCVRIHKGKSKKVSLTCCLSQFICLSNGSVDPLYTNFLKLVTVCVTSSQLQAQG